MNKTIEPKSIRSASLFDIEGTELKMKLVTTAYEGMTVSYIRYAVFVDEQKIPLEVEFDGSDAVAVSFLLFKGTTPIGTIRYVQEGKNQFHPGRIAMLKPYRKKGYGTMMIRWLHSYLRHLYGPCTMTIHAQLYLKKYYEKLGYQAEGKPFSEGGIDHIAMVKTIA